jgi:hypothetical protein
MQHEDYARMRPAVLRRRAADGDAAAVRELARRGETTEIDLTRLSYAELRALVLRWRDGAAPDDRARSRALAEQAQHELVARHRADRAMHAKHGGPAPRDVPMPPWAYPRPPRCLDWQRPRGSTLYPDETTREPDAATRAGWRRAFAHAAGEPQRSE